MLTNSYDPSWPIVNVTQSSCRSAGIALNIPLHFPAALSNVAMDTGVVGGGGSGSTGAHPANPAIPLNRIPQDNVRSHSFITHSSSASVLREDHHGVNDARFYLTRPSAVHAATVA